VSRAFGLWENTLARKLAPHLAATEGGCEVLTLDALSFAIAPVSGRTRETELRSSDALDWPLLAEHLSALARRESIEEPLYLFDQQRGQSDS